MLFNLFVDDVRSGPDTTEVGWENWVVARSMDIAMRLVARGIVNDLSLDHDMGYNSETGVENTNGKQFVMWMVETNNWPRGIITIHSANIQRAIEMKELIDKFRPKE